MLEKVCQNRTIRMDHLKHRLGQHLNEIIFHQYVEAPDRVRLKFRQVTAVYDLLSVPFQLKCEAVSIIMMETGAIPKVQYRRIRRPLSEISNLQSNGISQGFVLSRSLANNSTGSINVRNGLSEAKKVLEELRKKVDQMKTTISEIENMDPTDISFLIESDTSQQTVRDFSHMRRVRFQAASNFPEKEIREVQEEIAVQEVRIGKLKSDFSNKRYSQLTAASSESPLTEICSSNGKDVKKDENEIFYENIEKEIYDSSKNQAEAEKKLLEEWADIKNSFKDVSLKTFEEVTSGSLRQLKKKQKTKDAKKILKMNEKIKNNDSIRTYSSYNGSKESYDTSSSENICIDCETIRTEHEYIEKNEPKVVIENSTKDINSDEENREERSIGVENELYNAIQIQEASIVQKREIENGIQAEHDVTGHENPIYIDIRAYDFIEVVSKMKESLDAKSKENKMEEPNCLEALQDFNKSLCWEDSGMDELLLKISQVSFAALQSTKLIEMCIKKPQLETSRERIEAESILLLSGLKRELLNEKMKRLNSNNKCPPKKGCMRISQIRMPLIYSPEAHPKIKRYYVVVFQGGDQLFSSGVLEPNRHSYLEIGESFIFEELPADFVIKISVYSMYVEQTVASNRNSSACLPFKCMKELFTSRKSSEVSPIFCWEEREPSFILHGQCDITLSKLHKTPFTINGVPPTICLINTMECKIETAVTLKNSEKGYLSIGNYRHDGTVSWRRQWCVVDGTKLKLWNEQQNEEEHNPEELNLSRCLVQWECMRKCVCQ